MGAVNQPDPAAEALKAAWVMLDEASQLLLRAESIVLLLGNAHEVPEHHIYGAEIECGLLRTLKEKLSDAQEMVRTPRRQGIKQRPGAVAGR